MLAYFNSPPGKKPLKNIFLALNPLHSRLPADKFIPSPPCLTLQYQIQTERQRIQTEFNQLRSILDSEERRELQKLEEEEKKTLDSLAVAEAELVQQGELLKELISDLERRSEWSTVELLQVRRAIQPAVLNPCQLPSRLCP